PSPNMSLESSPSIHRFIPPPESSNRINIIIPVILLIFMNQQGLIDVTAETTIVQEEDYIRAITMNIEVNQSTDEYIVDTCTFTNCLSGAIDIRLSNGGKASVINSQFTGCQTSGSGGAINANIQSGGILTIDGQCRFTKCTSQNSGGGINLWIEGDDSKLIFGEGLIFDTCSSYDNGGGLYANIRTGSQLIFEGDCKFINCSANSGSGGGMHSQSSGEGSLIRVISELLFENCSSSFIGGGAFISAQDKASIELNRVTCIDCKGSQGAGLSIQFGSNAVLTISGQSSFTRCESLDNGGGIYFDIQRENVEIRIIGPMNFTDCIGRYGGGMHINTIYQFIIVMSSSYTFHNCTGYDGGGIYLSSSNIDS
ncbi:MAG: hypothetical protein EZS28_047768, partial [Streblomastix strix]